MEKRVNNNSTWDNIGLQRVDLYDIADRFPLMLSENINGMDKVELV